MMLNKQTNNLILEQEKIEKLEKYCTILSKIQIVGIYYTYIMDASKYKIIRI